MMAFSILISVTDPNMNFYGVASYCHIGHVVKWGHPIGRDILSVDHMVKWGHPIGRDIPSVGHA